MGFGFWVYRFRGFRVSRLGFRVYGVYRVSRL